MKKTMPYLDKSLDAKEEKADRDAAVAEWIRKNKAKFKKQKEAEKKKKVFADGYLPSALPCPNRGRKFR